MRTTMVRALEKLKKACPWLYALVKGIDHSVGVTYRCRMLCAKLTESRARYWSNQNVEEIRKIWEARHAPSSSYLKEALGGIEFASLLELGSSCGNRLAAIAAERPGVRLVGIDISQLAVTCGNKWLSEVGIGNATLKWGRIEDLSTYADQSFDVVFSWAALMYVRPARILNALRGILRVSAKAIVLIEMQNASKEEDRRGVYHPPGNWKRDYIALLEEAGADPARIKCEWVDKKTWSPGGGGGACITYAKGIGTPMLSWRTKKR
jgi:hypothetical protein